MSSRSDFEKDLKNPYAISYFKFLKTAAWVDLRIKESLKPYNLTHSQLNVLNLLVKNHPKPMDAKTIKANLVVASPDLTRLLDRLVKKGLVNRKTCSTNRRKIDITVTKEGIETFYKLHGIAKSSVNNFFEDNLSTKDARELYRILNKINT